REDEPALEVVAPALPRQPRCAQLVDGEPLLRCLAHERRPAGREPEPEFAADLLAETAAREVVARQRAALRIPEVALVERRGLVERRPQPLDPAVARIVAGRRLVVLERDSETLGK